MEPSNPRLPSAGSSAPNGGQSSTLWRPYAIQDGAESTSSAPRGTTSFGAPGGTSSAPIGGQSSSSAPIGGESSSSAVIGGQSSSSAAIGGQSSSSAAIGGQSSSSAAIGGESSSSTAIGGEFKVPGSVAVASSRSRPVMTRKQMMEKLRRDNFNTRILQILNLLVQLGEIPREQVVHTSQSQALSLVNDFLENHRTRQRHDHFTSGFRECIDRIKDQRTILGEDLTRRAVDHLHSGPLYNLCRQRAT